VRDGAPAAERGENPSNRRSYPIGEIDRSERLPQPPLGYFDATVAASRFRPLARRRFSTARPAFVFIRSRKPC
jgi:hypothetical protein